MRAKHWRKKSLVVAGLALFAGGCSLFETRSPEAGSSESDWVPPLIATQIVTNLEVALESGDFNDYRRTFVEEFFFVPDQTDVAQIAIERPGEAVYDDWNRDVETDTMEQVFSTSDSLRVDFDLFEERIEGEVTQLRYRYTLRRYRGSDVDELEGQAWYRVGQVFGGEWYILEWEDVISEDTGPDGSWGLLKGRERIL